MPRRSSKQTVDILIAEYERAHRELALELDSILHTVSGTDARRDFIRQRIALVQAAIQRMRTGQAVVDPLTGQLLLPLEGPIDPRTGKPRWTGMVGPEGENGLAAEMAQESYAVGLNLGEAVLEAQGAPVGPVTPRWASLHEIAAEIIADTLTDDTSRHLDVIFSKRARQLREIGKQATIAGITKGENVGELTTRMVRKFSESNKTKGGFTDARGVEWSIERYARLLARTVPTQAAQEALDDQAKREGHDLVLIVGGIGTTTCPTCRGIVNRESQVFSRSGTSDEHPPLQEQLDATPPLFHPHCGHQAVPWVDKTKGITEAELEALAERVEAEMGAGKLMEETD